MMRTVRTFLLCGALVPFLAAADSAEFRDELAVRSPYAAHWSRPVRTGECDFSRGLSLRDDYGLGASLETAADDLRAFLSETGLASAGGLPLVLARGETGGRESHRIEVTAEGVRLVAGDDEGMRRAVCAFERRLLAAEAPALPVGVTTRKPWLGTRLSRCFFGPINRPPLNHDELTDDVDYYPDAYLDQLAHEGVNGLWIVVRFRDLAGTSFAPADADAPRRIAKLRRTVAKLARYGIRLYLFAIEPRRIAADDPLALAHPEFVGAASWTPERIFCAGSAAAKRLLEDEMRSIFTAVPGLGGFIGITHGERPTNCLSELSPVAPGAVTCPRCRGLPPWRIHADTVGALAKGMRDAAPDARFFSWFYHPQPTPHREPYVFDCAAHVPAGVGFAYNFESGVVVEQEGRPRVGGDYWLSAVGPGEPFRRVAEAVRGTGTPLMAKIQASCSHSMATVPFVPAPGLLHRKYRAMKACGVTDVMLSWYIGSAPGVMTEAAGELAFDGCETDEDAFVESLARPLWGRDAPRVAALYRGFADGYALYPLSNDMQYFGPFSDGVVWPLEPDLALKELPPTYKPGFVPGGDEIGDALENHTLEEAERLADRMLAAMSVRTADGADELSRLADENRGDRARLRELGVMKAVRLLTEAARDVFRFHRARREAVCAVRDRDDRAAAVRALDGMAAVVENELRVTREMLPLAAADRRLGYHGDSETHRFDPRTLEARLGTLVRNRTRIREIAAAVARGEGYPESATERAAPTFAVTRTATGAFLFEGRITRVPDGPAALTFFDRCGTAFPKTVPAEVKGGCLRAEVAPSVWGGDERLRPGWFFVTSGDGVETRWPAVPEVPHRLNLNRRQISICARVVVTLTK